VKEAASTQARVDGEDDLFNQKWRRVDCLRRFNEAVVLILREIAQPRVVFVEELHSRDRIRGRKTARDAPVEEGLQDCQVLVDSGVSHSLGASQFHIFDQRGRDFGEQRTRLDVCLSHGKRRLDVRVV
jgi:hypothetical protein